MNARSAKAPSDISIFRRLVDAESLTFDRAASEAILRIGFSSADRSRINELAAKNRKSSLTAEEDEELASFIRVGQALGVLQSKARRSLKASAVPGRKSK